MNPAAPVTRTRTALEPDPVAEGAPDVDDVPAIDVEAAVWLVGRAEDEDLASAEHVVERDEAAVVDVGIRAEDVRAGPRQELPELVRQRGPRVVRFCLEGHAENADRLAAQ